MKNEITPNNWLYNAGIIGLISVLDEEDYKISNSFLNDDGSIDKDVFIEIIKETFNNIKNTLPKPLDKLSVWHWNYISQSFIKNYGTIEQFISRNIQRAQNSNQKIAAKDQLTVKGFKYCDVTVDFNSINKTIDESFKSTFGKNATKNIEDTKQEILNVIKKQESEYVYRKSIGYLFSKGGYYQNYFYINNFDDLEKFLQQFSIKEFFKKNETKDTCHFCANNDFAVERVSAEMMSFLFPVYTKFPNAFWNMNENQVVNICSLCKFFILHHHISLIKLSDFSEIFINAPSFKIMYNLNKIARELFGSIEKQETQEKRKILAMTVIEYSTKIKSTLGKWTEMNLEIISKKGSSIDFFQFTI